MSSRKTPSPAPADRHLLAFDREALPARPPPARMTSAAPSRPSLRCRPDEIARLANSVGGCCRLTAFSRSINAPHFCSSSRLRIDEPALCAVQCHGNYQLSSSRVPVAGRAPGKDLGQPLHVVPLMISSPPSCLCRRRFTSSARRMSILPCSSRRWYEISVSSLLSCEISSLSSLSLSAPRSGMFRP